MEPQIYIFLNPHFNESMLLWFHESRTTETWNCRIMEPRIQVFMNPCFCDSMNPEPQNHGTTELWNRKSTFLWFHESITMELQNYGTMNPHFCGSMNPELQNHESRTMESWIHGPMVSWNH